MALFLTWGWPELPCQLRETLMWPGEHGGWGGGAVVWVLPTPSSLHSSLTGLGGRKLNLMGGLHLLLHTEGLERGGTESGAGQCAVVHG